MCKWEATLYRCAHFTLSVVQTCDHGPADCPGVEQLLFVTKKNKAAATPGESGAFLAWCPHKCEKLIEAGEQDQVVARSRELDSGETDMDVYGKMHLLAGAGQEILGSDYDAGEKSVSFGDFVAAYMDGLMVCPRDIVQIYPMA